MEEKHYIGMEIHSLANMTMRFIEQNSHKKMIDSVTGTNVWILGLIEHQEGKEIFQRDLEEKFGITRSTVSKVVNLMVRKGLIERSPVEYDARLKKLSLTEKSRELLAIMKEDHETVDKVLMQGFSEEEKAKLREYVCRMKQNLKNMQKDTDEDPCCFRIGEEE